MSAARTKMSDMKSKNPELHTDYKAWSAFSLELSSALNLLSYGYNATKSRHSFMEKLSRIIRFVIFAGSKAEGLTKLNEKDYDLMIPLTDFVCTDDTNDVGDTGETVVLLTDRLGASPGYTKVKLAYPKRDGDFFLSRGCIREKNNNVHIPSHVFKDILTRFVGSNSTELSSNGPALTLDEIEVFDTKLPEGVDFVVAVLYKSYTLMRAWQDRPRCNDWPDGKAIQEVSQLDWHIVPVGSDKDGDGFQEWRICFTQGEIYLIKTFNETQLQLLILLKQIADKVLKPDCPAITSYVMKNLVLWMSEILPYRFFKSRNLCFLLMVSLTTLRSAVDNRHLKNYMIPARNLLKDKMTSDERRKITKLLDRLLDEGPTFLLNIAELSEIKEAVEKANEDVTAARDSQLHQAEVSIIRDAVYRMANPRQQLSEAITTVASRMKGVNVERMHEFFMNLYDDKPVALFNDLRVNIRGDNGPHVRHESGTAEED